MGQILAVINRESCAVYLSRDVFPSDMNGFVDVTIETRKHKTSMIKTSMIKTSQTITRKNKTLHTNVIIKILFNLYSECVLPILQICCTSIFRD